MTFVIQILIALLLSIAISAAIAWFVGRVMALNKENVPTVTPARKESIGVMGKLEWTADDIAVLRNFHNTPTGAKYLQNAQALIAATCINSCGEVMHTAHSAGVGHGMNEFLRWHLSLASDAMLQTLSAPAPLPQDDTSEVYGQDSLLEKYRP